MAVEKLASKTDVVVKLVLVFFVCLLSFSIGTFVGKKFSDSQHKIAKFEPESHDRGVASVNPDSHDVKPGDALTDDEVAKLAEEFVAEDKNGVPTLPGHGEDSGEHMKTDKNSEGVHAASNDHGDSHAPPAKEVAAAPTAKRTTQSVEPLHAATQVAHNENPAAHNEAPKAQNRIPTALPKEIAPSAIGKFTVQIASYPEENDAKKMAADLKTKGFSAFYVSAKVKDKKTNSEKDWYRVSVGLFTTQKEAEAYKQDLLSRSKVSSAIVQKITE